MSKDQSKRLRKKYLPAVIKETFDTWLKYIPEKARAPLFTKGCVAISFTITRTGKASMMKLDHPSGDRPLDLAAWGAITYSTYLPLPNDYPNDELSLRLTFLYNQKPGKGGVIPIQNP